MLTSHYTAETLETVATAERLPQQSRCQLKNFVCRQKNSSKAENMLRLKTPRLSKALLAGRNPFQPSLLISLSSIERRITNVGNLRIGSQGIRTLSTTVRDKDNSITGRNSRLYIYPELSKYRLSALVVVTSAAGFLCAGAPIDLCSLIAVTTGTALCAASAGTFNQVIERFHDAKMLRTRLRPLPSGRISTAEAFSWGATSGIAGTALLYTGRHFHLIELTCIVVRHFDIVQQN